MLKIVTWYGEAGDYHDWSNFTMGPGRLFIICIFCSLIALLVTIRGFPQINPSGAISSKNKNIFTTGWKFTACFTQHKGLSTVKFVYYFRNLLMIKNLAMSLLSLIREYISETT